jgi:tetratricopeptide (TPR) repeat protein/V8-like Glu-specific endopeptidase
MLRVCCGVATALIARGVIGLGVVISPTLVIFSPLPVWADAHQTVAKIAKPITVLIETPESNGSGVIISKGNGRYTVLTAAHVINNKQKSYKVVASDGQKYQLESIQPFSTSIDLAIGEFASTREYSVAKMGNSDNVAEGSLAFVAGFPRTNDVITKSVYSFRDGRIIANSSKPMNGGYGIIYSARTLPGMSGGGVFNDAGELIAIHGRGDIDTTMKPDEINPNVRFKTGNDLGIPINTFTKNIASLPKKVDVAVNQPVKTPRATAASDSFVEGLARAEKKDHQGAIVRYTRAIAIKHDFAAAYLNRSISKEEVGDRNGSESDLKRAFQIDPNQPAIYLNQGVTLYLAGDKQGALKNYNKALQLQPDDPIAFYNRAIVYGDLQEYRAAAADYTQVLKYYPRSVVAVYNRGVMYMQLGDRANALADFDQTIKLQPNYPQALNNRGNLKFQMNNHAGAVQDYSQAIALRPDYALAYVNRASAHLGLKNTPAAIADLKVAAQLYQKQGNQAKYQEVMALYKRLGGK